MQLVASHRHRKSQLALAAAALVAGATALALKAFGRAHGSATPLELKSSIIVNRSREDLYRFCRQFSNLGPFMHHVDAVEELEGTSVWTARAADGTALTWDAALVADRRNERIAWRSLEGAMLENHGSLEFRRNPSGPGTEVHMELGFTLPSGPLGPAFSKLFATLTEHALQQDLRRFKRELESEPAVEAS